MYSDPKKSEKIRKSENPQNPKKSEKVRKSPKIEQLKNLQIPIEIILIARGRDRDRERKRERERERERVRKVQKNLNIETTLQKGQQVKNRGAKMTAKKRALDYPDDLEARGDDELCCKFRNVPVQHKEKSTATGHVKSAGHKRHKLAHTTRLFKPGAATMVLDAPWW